ncbi:MazG-like family protein [Oceanobacillus sp. CF4.6]|uniref:MazG-like family protein n=1 Tax=Oceanobacillus sp. CF4.6 TaxID=3373080 RepID=UPI003EE786F4
MKLPTHEETTEFNSGLMKRTKVLNDIHRERERQFYLHGEQKETPMEMLYIFLAEEMGEVAEAIQTKNKLDNVKETDSDNLYQELVEVAAVAVKMAERLVDNGVVKQNTRS